jgi:myosin heavy subunit
LREAKEAADTAANTSLEKANQKLIDLQNEKENEEKTAAADLEKAKKQLEELKKEKEDGEAIARTSLKNLNERVEKLQGEKENEAKEAATKLQQVNKRLDDLKEEKKNSAEAAKTSLEEVHKKLTELRENKKTDDAIAASKLNEVGEELEAFRQEMKRKEEEEEKASKSLHKAFIRFEEEVEGDKVTAKNLAIADLKQANDALAELKKEREAALELASRDLAEVNEKLTAEEQRREAAETSESTLKETEKDLVTKLEAANKAINSEKENIERLTTEKSNEKNALDGQITVLQTNANQALQHIALQISSLVRGEAKATPLWIDLAKLVISPRWQLQISRIQEEPILFLTRTTESSKSHETQCKNSTSLQLVMKLHVIVTGKTYDKVWPIQFVSELITRIKSCDDMLVAELLAGCISTFAKTLTEPLSVTTAFFTMAISELLMHVVLRFPNIKERASLDPEKIITCFQTHLKANSLLGGIYDALQKERRVEKMMPIIKCSYIGTYEKLLVTQSQSPWAVLLLSSDRRGLSVVLFQKNLFQHKLDDSVMFSHQTYTLSGPAGYDDIIFKAGTKSEIGWWADCIQNHLPLSREARDLFDRAAGGGLLEDLLNEG